MSDHTLLLVFLFLSGSPCSLLPVFFDHSDFSHSKSVITTTSLSTGIWFGPTGRLLDQSYCVSLIWIVGWYLSLRLTRAQPQTTIHCLETSRQVRMLQSMLALYLWIVCSYFWAILRRLFGFYFYSDVPAEGLTLTIIFYTPGQSFVCTSHIFCLTYFRWVWGASEKKPINQIPKSPEGTSVSVLSWQELPSQCTVAALWCLCLSRVWI